MLQACPYWGSPENNSLCVCIPNTTPQQYDVDHHQDAYYTFACLRTDLALTWLSNGALFPGTTNGGTSVSAWINCTCHVLQLQQVMSPPQINLTSPSNTSSGDSSARTIESPNNGSIFSFSNETEDVSNNTKNSTNTVDWWHVPGFNSEESIWMWAFLIGLICVLALACIVLVTRTKRNNNKKKENDAPRVEDTTTNYSNRRSCCFSLKACCTIFWNFCCVWKVGYTAYEGGGGSDTARIYEEEEGYGFNHEDSSAIKLSTFTTEVGKEKRSSGEVFEVTTSSAATTPAFEDVQYSTQPILLDAPAGMSYSGLRGRSGNTGGSSVTIDF